MKVRLLRAGLASAIAVGALAACGGDDGDADGSTTTSTAGATTAATTVTTTTTAAAATGVPTGSPMLVDTDLAADDVVALSYLASHPEVDLLAVTVAGTGEVRCPRGADIARGLLAVMDRGHVPVACGRSEPVSGDRQFPEPWRDAADNAWGLMLQVVTPPEQPVAAAELLIEELRRSHEPVTVLTLGPLTNLAEALELDPELGAHIERVVVMGGAVGVPGNVYPGGASQPLAAEWNLYVDPDAAAAVFGSGLQITLVALDATNEVPVTDDVIERLAANDTTEATARVLQLFDLYPPEYLWDPLAAIAAADPALVPTHPAEIAVVTTGDDAGRTQLQPGGASIVLADPPAVGAVLDHLLKTLAGVPEEEQLATPTTLPVLGGVSVAFDGSTCTYTGDPTLATGAYIVTLEPAAVPYVAAVAHLAEGATVDEVLAWIGEHPEEEPPMVDEVTVVGGWGEASPATVAFSPGTVAIACGTEDGAISFADSVAVTE